MNREATVRVEWASRMTFPRVVPNRARWLLCASHERSHRILRPRFTSSHRFGAATNRRHCGARVRAGVHPDAISLASIVAAAAAGTCFFYSSRFPILLLVGPPLCYVRLWLNMLDGMVASAAASTRWSARRDSKKMATKIDRWGIFTVSLARRA